MDIMSDTMIMRTLIDVFTTIISMIPIIILGLIPSIVLADTFEMRQYLGHIEQTAALYNNAQIKITPPDDVTRITFNQDEIIFVLRDGTQVTHELVRENLIKDVYLEEDTEKLIIIT